MMQALKRALVILGMLLSGVVVSAQLGTVPYTFTSGTSISSSQMNAIFSDVYAKALLRTGGVMTGTLTARDIIPSTTNTYALGDGTHLFSNVYATNATLTAATITTGTISTAVISTLTCTGCVGATQIASTAVTPGTYTNSTGTGVQFIVDADGRLTSATTVGFPIGGALASRSTGTDYQASTGGGLVTVYLDADTDGDTGYVTILSDTNTTPTTAVAGCSVQRVAASSIALRYCTASFHVQPNYYYRATLTNSSGTVTATMYFRPIGS